MIQKDKVLVIDIDGTLCDIKTEEGTYADVLPIHPVIEKLRKLKEDGWYFIFHSSRGMRTYDGNLGLINVHVLPTLLKWLERHSVPFDEVHMAKPWPGHRGVYIDDRSVRPGEFLRYDMDVLDALISTEREHL